MPIEFKNPEQTTCNICFVSLHRRSRVTMTDLQRQTRFTVAAFLTIITLQNWLLKIKTSHVIHQFSIGYVNISKGSFR